MQGSLKNNIKLSQIECVLPERATFWDYTSELAANELKYMKPQIIAFYLPQYYPFKENDEWWGKGFTEWTNVGKAKPLFKGHNQPRVPTELGYYDLRLPEVREQQAELAREAGVTAFCYWHYWFGNGKRLLERVFDEVLESGKPDFPFCLGWANHSWYAKTWDINSQKSDKLLIEQTYPGLDDAKMHFDFLVKAFKDPRYIKIDGKPLFFIFRPKDLPESYINYFQKRAIAEGFPGILFVAQLTASDNKEFFIKLGYDLFVVQRLGAFMERQKFKGQTRLLRYIRIIKGLFQNRPPFCYDYANSLDLFVTDEELANDVLPSIVPQWDHTPRSGWNGSLYINATPKLFYKQVKKALNVIKDKPDDRKIIFLKSWNEWGEGNFMEPDLTYGRGFCEALRKALDE